MSSLRIDDHAVPGLFTCTCSKIDLSRTLSMRTSSTILMSWNKNEKKSDIQIKYCNKQNLA